ncbi:hypothetical protein C0989_008144 [Termitomyces sp. Mn162]|nr:hypothetical protein C0989_008144 [Termitomyces sp. Mn162]
MTNISSQSPAVQSFSPLSPIGVDAAVEAARDPTIVSRPKIFEEFSLKDRVGVVTGGNRGIGLEMALALCELGARAIYCFDLPSEPSDEWKSTQDFVKKLGAGSRLEYVSADVRDQKGMWNKVKDIGDREGRMDVCVAAAGVAVGNVDSLVCPEDVHQGVMDVNTNGVLFTAQAAGQQMLRFGNAGSIILIASIAGSAALKVSFAQTTYRCGVGTDREVFRVATSFRTTQAKPRSFKWVGAWRANSEVKESASTQFPRDSFAPRS